MSSSDLRLALRATWPVLLGYLPLGVGFGVLLASTGLPWWWAPIFSGVIFAGSAEFLTLSLAMAGSPLPQTALTALAVNIRHVFYGLSFPLHKVRGLPAQAYSVHTLTDEAYAVLTPYRDRPATSGFLVTSQALGHLYWTGGSTLGALAGASLDLSLPGLEFVLTALFVVLTIDAYRAALSPLVLGAAVVCGLVARWVFGGSMLAPALTAFVVFLLVARGRWIRLSPGSLRPDVAAAAGGAHGDGGAIGNGAVESAGPEDADGTVTR